MTFAKSVRLLGSREAALLTLVGTAEAAAFLAPPDGSVPTLWARKLYSPFAGQYHSSAPVAAGHSNGANLC